MELHLELERTLFSVGWDITSAGNTPIDQIVFRAYPPIKKGWVVGAPDRDLSWSRSTSEFDTDGILADVRFFGGRTEDELNDSRLSISHKKEECAYLSFIIVGTAVTFASVSNMIALGKEPKQIAVWIEQDWRTEIADKSERQERKDLDFWNFGSKNLTLEANSAGQLRKPIERYEFLWV